MHNTTQTHETVRRKQFESCSVKSPITGGGKAVLPTACLAMTLNFRTTSSLSVRFLYRPHSRVILLPLKGTAHPKR